MPGLAITTFGDLIMLAMRSAGVIGTGQTALAEDINDAGQILNAMIGQWQRRRWLVYHLIDVTCAANGQETYTVGPGGQFDVGNRPAEIKSMFARQTVTQVPNEIDYPIELLTARETYNLIALKSMESFPRWAWYDASYPLGTLYVYPVIQPTFELHISVAEVLQTVSSVSDVINIPPEYIEALLYNLAVRLAINYKIDVPQGVASLAQAALETLRSVNAQIPRMELPVPLRRPYLYNIFSDSAS